MDAALLVLHDLVINLEKVIEQIFLMANTDVRLRANIEKHLQKHPPIQRFESAGHDCGRKAARTLPREGIQLFTCERRWKDGRSRVSRPRSAVRAAIWSG